MPGKKPSNVAGVLTFLLHSLVKKTRRLFVWWWNRCKCLTGNTFDVLLMWQNRFPKGFQLLRQNYGRNFFQYSQEGMFYGIFFRSTISIEKKGRWRIFVGYNNFFSKILSSFLFLKVSLFFDAKSHTFALEINFYYIPRRIILKQAVQNLKYNLY